MEEVINKIKNGETRLELIYKIFSDEEYIELFNALSTNTTVTSIDLYDYDIDRKGVEYLAKVLSTNTSVTSINLDVHNYIGDKGVEYLANALYTNTTVTSIDLGSNKIGDKGVEYLAKALSTNTSVTSIDLGGNKIGDKGAEYLAKALYTNTTVTSIDLGNNKISDEGAEYLAKALSTNSTLTFIDLIRNDIGHKADDYLANAILGNSSLIDIDGICLKSSRCRNILGLDKTFSNKSNKDILAFLRYKSLNAVEFSSNVASPINQNVFSTIKSPVVLTSTSNLTEGIVRLIVVDNNGSVKGCPCLYEAKLTSKHTGTRFYIGDVVEFRQGSEVDVHEFKVINTYMQLAEDSCYMRIRCTVSHDTTVFLTILDN